MPREIKASATHLYATRVTDTYRNPDGAFKTSVRLWGPYDTINPARAQFNSEMYQKKNAEDNGILGPLARPRWNGVNQPVNVDRTIEMVRTTVSFEEESTW